MSLSMKRSCNREVVDKLIIEKQSHFISVKYIMIENHLLFGVFNSRYAIPLTYNTYVDISLTKFKTFKKKINRI